MARVIGASPLIQFETNDLFNTRFYFSRMTFHSIVVSSPAGENGKSVHVFVLNLLPGPVTQLTAYYETVEARDQALLRLMEEFNIDDSITKAAVATL